MADETPITTTTSSSNSFSVADPAPLGLAAFALTTFLLSIVNANWTSGNAWLPYALAYGGLGQLLAGMWEFKRGNTFGATAFSTYGAFWIGLWFFATKTAAAPDAKPHDLGFILLAFFLFNTVLLLCSVNINMAVFAVFLTLEITELLLWIGILEDKANIVKIGGVVGVITAIVAWYTAAAGLKASVGGKLQLPVGRPMNF
jgi:succinate-acetate transporter protein